MINFKKLIKKRNKLLYDAMQMREYAWNKPIEQSIMIREEQDKLWKQYIFYKKLIESLSNGKKY